MRCDLSSEIVHPVAFRCKKAVFDTAFQPCDGLLKANGKTINALLAAGEIESLKA
jgi:hypothetical protein